MDIVARLQQLQELVQEAKSMPLSSSVLINREEVLEMLQQMQESLPEEIKQARWVVKDREDLLVKARRDAEALIHRARAEQARLISQEAVIKESQIEAEQILAEAREQARQVGLEAEDYVDAKLASYEAAIGRTVEELSRADEQLVATGESLTEVGRLLEKGREQAARGRDRLRRPTAGEQAETEEGG